MLQQIKIDMTTQSLAQWNLDPTHSEAQFKEEFGLTWSAVTEAGGVVVGSDVKLLFNVQFAPAQA